MNLNTATTDGRRSARAFTMSDVFIGVLLVGLVTALVVLVCVPKRGSWPARVTAAQAQIATFGTALDAFQIDTGMYPASTSGLAALFLLSPGFTNWKGPYLKGTVPLDPWGDDYFYKSPGTHHPRAYDLASGGPDGIPGTCDDIKNW